MSLRFSALTTSMGMIDNLIQKLPKLGRFLCIWTIDQGAFAIGYVNFVIFAIPIIFDIIWVIGTAGAALGILIFSFLIHVIHALLSIYLIVAVKHESSERVYTWIFCSLVMVILNIIAFILSIIITFVAVFTSGIITTIWYIYCILIVNSYYQNMDGGPVNY